MRFRYRSEEEMKDSGVEWIGKIPIEWNVSKAKYLLDNLDDKRIPLSAEERGKMKEQKYDYYGASGIIDKVDSYIFDDTLILVGEDGANLFSRNTPLAYLASGKFWVNNHAHILKPKKGNINYFVNSLENTDYTILISGSAQPKLTQENLMNIPVLNPDINIQNKIANFLDEKTSQFDTIISKKEALIQTLEEAKKSLISEVVTGKVKVVKTSDGYELVERKKEEMKDSGVEWLGNVPKEWKVKKLKYIATLNPSKSTVRKFVDENIDVSFVPMESVRLGYISLEQCKNIKDVIDGYTLFEEDDIIMAKVTPCFENKNVAICRELKNGIGFGSTELNTIRCFKKSDIEYLFYHLQEQNFMDIATYEMTGAGGLKRVPSNFLLNAQFSYPEEYEKLQIVEYLNQKMMVSNNLINKTQLQIQKLKEAKQSLISEAVTGKIEILD